MVGMDSTSPRLLWALSLLLLVAWGAHWHTFSRPELGLDGALSVDLARSPLGDMLNFNARDVHPPLFYALLKGWLWLTGAHYLTAKYIAIAASLPTLPLLYQLGRRLLPARAGGVAVLLLAVAPATLFLAPTVRDFSLGLSLYFASTVVTLDLCVHPSLPPSRPRIRLLALALLTMAALLTWYFQLFLLGTEAVVLLYAHRRVVAAHLALIAGTVLALPWYVYVIPHITGKLTAGTTTFGSAPQLPHRLDLLNGLARALFGEPWSGGAALALAGWLLALVIGLLTMSPVPRRRAASMAQRAGTGRCLPAAELFLYLALVTGATEVALTTLRWSDVGALGRYVLPLLPFLALLQARALTNPRLLLRLLATAGLVVFVPIQLIWFHSLATGTPIDWSYDQALAYVTTHAAPGDAILFNDRARRGRYLLDNGPLLSAVIHSAGQAYLADSAAQADQTAASLTQHAARIWLVEIAPSVNVAQAALATDAFGLPAQDVAGSSVQLFLTQAASPLRPIGVTFGGVIALDSAAVPTAASPGAAIPFQFVWRDVQPSAVSYTVFLHITNAAGKLIAQHDSPPVLGFSPTSAWHAGQIFIDRCGVYMPADLPPGEYDMQVGLYKGDTRLTLQDGNNLIDLGKLRVTG
ncbi:MAG: hypothetical protein ACR2JY_04480 [Chloroflexota bacterium]